jgi:hypothetical protein
MKSFKTFLLAASCFGSFEVVAGPSFYGKSLPELLQYTGARCAYDVTVQQVETENPGIYTGLVTATQTARYGEIAELDAKLRSFNVVATNNLRKDTVSADEGDDYYMKALSLADLKVGESYLLLCRGSETFEAISNTPDNAYKIKLFMAFNWEKKYATKTSLTQLKKDLGDADLAALAYSVLQRKGALSDQLVAESLRNQSDNRLLFMHLMKLSGEKFIGELEDAPQIKTAAQIDFLSLLLSQLKDSEVQQNLFQAFTKIMESDELLIDLNQTKIDILMSYLNLFKGTYRNQMALHNRLIEKIVSVTAAVPSYNLQFIEPVLLYSATSPSIRRTVTTYLSNLESIERIRFLNRMLALLEPLARVRYQTQSPRQIVEVLAEQIPLNPSGLYLRGLAAFNPYILDPKIPNEGALRKLLASKADSMQIRQQAQWIIMGSNFVVSSLNAILKKTPDTKVAVKEIGDRYTEASSPFATLVDMSTLFQYKKLIQTVPQSKLPKVAAGPK